MTKKEIIAQLKENGITADENLTIPVLEAQLKEVLASKEPATPPVTEVPVYKHLTLKRKQVRAIKERSVKLPFKNADSKTAIKYGTYNTYSFEGRADNKDVSLAFAAWEPKFIEAFDASEIYSVDLRGTVTGNIIPVDEYGNPAHEEILWEVMDVTTRKEHAQDRADAKEDAEDARLERMESLEKSVFSKANFENNPELIKSSGFLEQIMNASVGA